MIGRRMYSDILLEGGNRQQKYIVLRVIASNCTELSGATIDASCGRISLRDYGVAAITTEVGQQCVSALMPKKFGYNESRRLQ